MSSTRLQNTRIYFNALTTCGGHRRRQPFLRPSNEEVAKKEVKCSEIHAAARGRPLEEDVPAVKELISQGIRYTDIWQTLGIKKQRLDLIKKLIAEIDAAELPR